MTNDSTKSSKIGLMAERIWDNNKFQEAIKEARDCCKRNNTTAYNSPEVTKKVREIMNGQKFNISPLWDGLFASLIDNDKFPFIEAAKCLTTNTRRQVKTQDGISILYELNSEATEDDWTRTLNSIDRNKESEQPFPNRKYAIECKELKKKMTITEVVNFMQSKYKNESIVFDEDKVKKLIKRLNKRSHNR